MNTDPRKSATYCGCDEGAGYQCKRHRGEDEILQVKDAQTGTPVQVPIWRGIGGAPTRATTLPTDPAERKKHPVASGVLDYFPDAIVAISHVSWAGNEQHNPGQPLHWAREKSTDQDDTLIRHFLERGTRDVDGERHSAKLAWRCLALLQLEIEREKS